MNNNPKYNRYPVKRNEGQGSNIVPRFNYNSFNTPTTIVPKYAGKNHNVAGQIKTKIHLKNARGEEMDIYQTQQVLNLLNGDKSNWYINSGSGANKHTNNYRRK